MQKPRALSVVVAADKIVVRAVRHIGSRHGYVFIAGNIDARRIVLFVIDARRNRKGRNVPLSVIHHRRDVRREDGLRVVVHRNRRIRPPEKRLRKRRAVIELHVDFQVCPVGKQRHRRHSLGAEHVFDLADEDAAASVRVFPYFAVHRIERARPVMLRPIEFNPAGNPGPRKAHQRGFDHLIVVYEIVAVRFVVRALYAPAEFRQNHDEQVFIFEAERLIDNVARFVADRFDDGVRVDFSRAALIDAFFEENGVFIRRSCGVGRNRDFLLPNTDALFNLFELFAIHL